MKLEALLGERGHARAHVALRAACADFDPELALLVVGANPLS